MRSIEQIRSDVLSTINSHPGGNSPDFLSELVISYAQVNEQLTDNIHTLEKENFQYHIAVKQAVLMLSALISDNAYLGIKALLFKDNETE